MSVIRRLPVLRLLLVTLLHSKADGQGLQLSQGDLLNANCVTRSACVVEGNNLIKSIKTDSPIRLAGSSSTREVLATLGTGT